MVALGRRALLLVRAGVWLLASGAVPHGSGVWPVGGTGGDGRTGCRPDLRRRTHARAPRRGAGPAREPRSQGHVLRGRLPPGPGSRNRPPARGRRARTRKPHLLPRTHDSQVARVRAERGRADRRSHSGRRPPRPRTFPAAVRLQALRPALVSLANRSHHRDLGPRTRLGGRRHGDADRGRRPRARPARLDHPAPRLVSEPTGFACRGAGPHRHPPRRRLSLRHRQRTPGPGPCAFSASGPRGRTRPCARGPRE
jgi:hypothetical protein